MGIKLPGTKKETDSMSWIFFTDNLLSINNKINHSETCCVFMLFTVTPTANAVI